jgi:multidrug efflux system membrane fusion protein
VKLLHSPASAVARAAFVPIVCVMLFACKRHEAPAPAPRPVVAVAAQADGHANASSLPGQIQSRYSTPLSFRINGKILERRVRLGDSVKAGQVVARLDPADVEKNNASARAQLDAAEHQLVYAKQQLDRDRAQAAEHLIAPAQLEQTQNAYASALARDCPPINSATRHSPPITRASSPPSRPTPARTSRRARPSTRLPGAAIST